MVLDADHQPRGEQAHRDADGGRGQGGDQQPHHDLAAVEAGVQRLQGEREDDDSCAVVEEALSLDQGGQ